MKLENVSKRRLSSSSSLMGSYNDLLSIKSGVNSIYCAVFEFLQGSQPRVVWHYGSIDIGLENDFMWYIVSVPSIAETRDIFPKPTHVTSSFNEMKYSAWYMSIPDIEARGFSRSVCLVIASANSSMIDTVNLRFSHAFHSIIDMARDNSSQIFWSEIDYHIHLLDEHLKGVSEMNSYQQQLEEKLKRLNEIRNSTQYSYEQSNNSKDRCEISALVFINNDLRPIEYLINFSIIEQELKSVLKLCVLPTSILYGQVLVPNIFPREYVPMLAISNEKSFQFLNQVGILKHCIFSIMIGRPLIIESKNHEDIISFAEILPFRWDNDIHIFDSPSMAVDSIPYSISLTPDIIQGEDSQVSILSFVRKYYKGPLCPSKSFISALAPETKQPEKSFWLKVSFELCTFKERFAKFCLLYLAHTQRTRYDMMVLLEKHGFSSDDEYIFEYISHSVLSQEKSRKMPHMIRSALTSTNVLF